MNRSAPKKACTARAMGRDGGNESEATKEAHRMETD